MLHTDVAEDGEGERDEEGIRLPFDPCRGVGGNDRMDEEGYATGLNNL